MRCLSGGPWDRGIEPDAEAGNPAAVAAGS
jgi:hypothetical protein